jgi:hypothetical protein
MRDRCRRRPGADWPPRQPGSSGREAVPVVDVRLPPPYRPCDRGPVERCPRPGVHAKHEEAGRQNTDPQPSEPASPVAIERSLPVSPRGLSSARSRAPVHTLPLSGLGEDPTDHLRAPSLCDEPFVNSLQMEVEVSPDQFGSALVKTTGARRQASPAPEGPSPPTRPRSTRPRVEPRAPARTDARFKAEHRIRHHRRPTET